MTPSAAEHQAGGAPAPRLLANNAVPDTVAWLLHWWPDQARTFALAMHELAAWQYDDIRTEHWRCVLGLLPRG